MRQFREIAWPCASALPRRDHGAADMGAMRCGACRARIGGGFAAPLRAGARRGALKMGSDGIPVRLARIRPRR